MNKDEMAAMLAQKVTWRTLAFPTMTNDELRKTAEALSDFKKALTAWGQVTGSERGAKYNRVAESRHVLITRLAGSRTIMTDLERYLLRVGDDMLLEAAERLLKEQHG